MALIMSAELSTINLIMMAIISMQIVPAPGFSSTVPSAAANRSGSATLIRSTRSLLSTKKEFARQSCIGCTDDSAGMCTRKAFKRIKDYTEALACGPQSTLVKLHLPGPAYSMEPNLAKVNRCGGFCRYGHHSCIPTQTSFVRVPVMVTHLGTGAKKCAEYEVEQHDECTCECEVRKQDCSERHKHEHCSCKCSNMEEKFACLEEKLYPKNIWDEEKCECLCEPEICPRGFLWDPEACKCELRSRMNMENLLF